MPEDLAVCPAVLQGVVLRRCGWDGLWERDDSGHVWRDKSQCEEEEEVTSQEVQQMSPAQGLICPGHKCLVLLRHLFCVSYLLHVI